MSYPLPLTRTEAYLAYKAGVIQQSDLKPSLAVPRNGIDAWLAYWTGLADDYPKREDGTPHILQEEEAYIAFLAGVINEYPEKCLRRVGAYLRYLISARWGRPDHPLNREELYLSLIKTQVVPSGDPSSNIELDGTAEYPFLDVKMYGDTSQATYTGKNMFNLVTPETNNGVTVTANADGSFTINGTTTGVAVFNFILPDLKPAGTYTISCTSKNQVMGDDFFIRARNQNMGMLVPGGADGPSQIRGTGANYAEKTFVSTDPMYCLALNLTETGVTYNNMIIYPQVEAGSSATSFEPYVGGTASPNPDYPQAVNTVTGRQVVKVEGKNLLELAPQTATSNGITATLEDGVIFYSGKATTNWSNMSATVVKAIPAGSYTFSMKEDFYTNFAFCLWVTYEDNTTASFEAWRYGGKKKEITFTKNVKSCFVFLTGLTTGEEYSGTLSLMLEEGSTEGTPFVPYQSGEYELNLGKNLFDKDTVLEGKLLFANGTVGGDDPDYCTSDFIPIVPGKTYYKTWSTSVRFKYFGADKEPLNTTTYQDLPNAASPQSFVVPSGAYYLRLTLGTNNRSTLQIEVGSEATSYAPYFTPIELCKIRDYQDYIYENDDKWYLRKEIGSYTFDGSEGWIRSGSTTESIFVAAVGTTLGNYIQIKMNENSKSLMDRFIFSNQQARAEGRFNMYNGTAYYNALAISFDITEVPDITAAQTWVANNRPTLYGVLATATDTEITNTALIAQLNALKNGGSYEGKTYITVSDTEPNLPALLVVEAAKYA